MSSLPNSPLPHEPFDAEEAAAARAYRGLPGGEPSSELDARILAQARAVVAPKRRRPRPWFLGAGFGAAAAAVMAAGIAWQMGWLGGVPGSVPTSQGVKQTRPAARAREDESISVELYGTRDERKAQAEAAATVAEPAAPPPPAAPKAPPRPASAPPPPPPPAPTATEEMAEPAPVLDQPAPAPEPFPAEAEKDDERLRAAGEDAAGAAAPQQAGAEREQAGPGLTRDAELSKRAQSGFGDWTEDETLEPDAWIERIRERVRIGDRQGAEYSLRRFMFKHPTRTVPRELHRLLVE